MRIGVHSATTNRATVDDVVAEVRAAADAGLAGYWAPMLAGLDTLTALAVAGREVPGIELGTAVVPMPLRSPYALAQQVKTVQQVVAQRLVVGIGTSHEKFTTGVFGAEWRPPLTAARDYLPRLRDALDGTGTQVLLGAVNPKMVALAVELADGVITWSAGEATIAMIADAVRDAGRQSPFRVVAALPVCVTDDESGARAHIKARLGRDDGLPSYQKVLAREGVPSVADVSIVGSADDVAERLARFAAGGVTDFAAHVVAATEDDRAGTWSLLRRLAVDG
jgi:5,10-methylenetetrahydromethanopterin reductase